MKSSDQITNVADDGIFPESIVVDFSDSPPRMYCSDVKKNHQVAFVEYSKGDCSDSDSYMIFNEENWPFKESFERKICLKNGTHKTVKNCTKNSYSFDFSCGQKNSKHKICYSSGSCEKRGVIFVYWRDVEQIVLKVICKPGCSWDKGKIEFKNRRADEEFWKATEFFRDHKGQYWPARTLPAAHEENPKGWEKVKLCSGDTVCGERYEYEIGDMKYFRIICWLALKDYSVTQGGGTEQVALILDSGPGAPPDSADCPSSDEHPRNLRLLGATSSGGGGRP